MVKKIRKKRSGPAPIRVVKKVRIPRQLALELHGFAASGDLRDAERHLRMLRPELDEHVIHEVCFRCADPTGAGGIETGHDPELGEYADVAITR